MHSLMWWCPLFGFPKKLLEYQFVLESPPVGCWQSEWGIQSGLGWLALIWLQCSLTSQVTKLRLWPHPQPFQPKWALESGLSSSVSLPPSLSRTTTSQTPSLHCLWSRDNRRDDCLRNLWWCVVSVGGTGCDFIPLTPLAWISNFCLPSSCWFTWF